MDFAAAISKLRAMPPEHLLARASRSVPPWLSLVLAVAAAWNLGGIFWLLVPPAPPGDVAPPPAPEAGGTGTAGAADGGGHDTQAIADAHLFGTFNPNRATAEQEAAAALADEDLPDTRLPLKLLGVLADGFGGGQAVIVNGRGSADVYRVNDSIEGQNATVDAVFDTWVRLRIGGRAERLTLPDFDDSVRSAVTRRTSSALRPTARTRESLVNELVAASNSSIRLSDIVRPQPVFENGQLEGYRVYPGRNRQAFSRLGLRPGDLVTGVNGTTITDPKQGIEMFRQLEGSAPIAVTVERGGQVETVVLDTSSLGLGSR